MENKELKVFCAVCGAQNIEMTKFCRSCGAKAELMDENDSGTQSQQTTETASEQVVQSPEQTQYQSEEQASPSPLGQPWHDKKKLGIIGAAVVGLIAIIVLVTSLSGTNLNVEESMRSQLERLDTGSYSDVVEWVENDFAESFAEYYDLEIMAFDTNYRFLGDGFLNDEERFIEWFFHLDEEEDTLFIHLTYEEVDILGLLVSELETLNQNSLSAILDWIEQAEDEHGREVHFRVRTICLDGDWLNSDIADMENEDLFEEWTFDAQGGFLPTIEFDLVFNTVRTFTFGDSFEFDGLEVVFDGDIGWDIVDNEWSNIYGAEYFKVPVTLTNISSTTNNRFSPRLYAPDGTQIDRIHITGAEDDITRMGGLRPDATQSGYIFIKFYEDGDYVIELRDWPLTIEVIIPVDSEELRGSPTPLTTGPVRTLEDIAADTQLIVDIDDNPYVTIEVEAYGENELIFTYVYFQVVPPGNQHLVDELMEGVIEDMMVFYSITAARIMLELGVDNAVITVVFVDSARTEFYRESIHFPR